MIMAISLIGLIEDRFSSTSETLNYPYVIRFLSYLFSPLPSTNINLFYLLEITQTTFITFYLIKLIQFYKPKINLITHPFFSYSIILTAILSLITFNVGISARQRWLIIPAIIISIMTTNRKPSKEIIN